MLAVVRRLMVRLQSSAWWANERGGNLVEYSILVSFIAFVAFLAVAFLGNSTTSNIQPVLNGL